MRRIFLTHLGLPGSLGLSENFEKHVIFGTFWPKLDYFGEHAPITKDRKLYGITKWLVRTKIKFFLLKLGQQIKFCCA